MTNVCTIDSPNQYFDFPARSDRQKGGASTDGGLPSQVAALAKTVLAAASKIDDLSSLRAVIESIGHKHVARGVEEGHYPLVGECLLHAMTTILKEEATAEVMGAWNEAYSEMANVFVDTEKKLNADLSKDAGVSGFSNMHVVSVEEGEGYRDLHLSLDGHGQWTVSEGQFVALDVDIGLAGRTMTSMCVVPGRSDRLTIRVPVSEERASLALWDVSIGSALRVSMPCGAPTKTPKRV